MSRPIQLSGTATPSSSRCSASASKRSPATMSTGSIRRQFDASAFSSARARELHPLLLDQRVAGRDALRAEEGEAHRTADQERVGGVEKAVDQGDLVAHLRAAEHHHERPLGGVDDRAERHDLVLEQEPGDRGTQVLGHAGGRGVGAMGRAERVVHVGVAERGELAREPRVVLGLAPLPARVLEHEHRRRLEPVDAAPHLRPHDVGSLVHLGVDQLAQPRRHGRQRGLRIAALRPAQVRAQHHPHAALQQELDRGQGGADARVVDHAAVLERHVEVHAREHALSGGHVEVANGLLAQRGARCASVGHLRRRAIPPARAVPGRRRGSSSPTRCRTRR